MNTEHNAIIIHGGGLVEPSKCVLMRIGKNLSSIYDKVYIGKYSFESLYTPEFIIRYNDELVQETNSKRGSYFGTSRGVDLCDSNLFKKTIECLTKKNIKTIIVAGGDGSSRQVAEISENFMEHGINIIFPIPLTIDGINGSLSIGINEACRESIRQIENIASTSLQTRDNGQFGVVMVELQGRNRDDILAKVLKHFVNNGKIADISLRDHLLIVVPTTLPTIPQKLFDKVNNSSKRTLILLSEGAKSLDSRLTIPEITEHISRKVRSLVVGHPSQSNSMTTQTDLMDYYSWIDKTCYIISKDPYNTYCISNNNNIFNKRFIDYYARLNPRNAKKSPLPEDLKYLLRSFMS